MNIKKKYIFLIATTFYIVIVILESIQTQAALCTQTCVMQTPSTTTTCLPGQTFTTTGYWTAIGTGCPTTKALYTQRYINTSWEITKSTGNLSTSTANPQTLPPYDLEDPEGTTASWTVTCNNAGNYTIRLVCNTTATTSKIVNVTSPIGCTPENLAASKTLDANNNSCFNISTNGVVVDCAGYKMQVVNQNLSNIYAFNMKDVSNITIKNCNITDYNIAIIADNVSNLTIYNNTIKTYLKNVTSGQVYSVYLKNVSKLNMTLNNLRGTYGACGTDCSISIYSLYLSSNYSVINNNIFNYTNYDDDVIMSPDPTIRLNVYATGIFNNWSNNVFTNATQSTTALLKLESSHNNTFINNTFSISSTLGIDLVSSGTNVFNNTYISDTIDSLVKLETSNNNNFTNLTANGSVGGYGVWITGSNNTFKNANVFNTRVAFNLGYSYYDSGCDCDTYVYAYSTLVNDSSLNASYQEIGGVTGTDTYSNRFTNTSLALDGLGGGTYSVWNYLTVNVTWGNGSAVGNATVNATDNSYIKILNTTTNANGLTNITLIKHSSGSTRYELHLVNATKQTNTTSSTVNLSSSKTVYLILTSGSASTCPCPATPGNWYVNMAEYCTLNTNCTITPGNLTYYNTGNHTINASLNVSNIINLTNGMTMWVYQRGHILLKGI